MAAQIFKPDPDSQFRLLPCGCGSSDVGYKKNAGDIWQVKCLRCGHTGTEAKIRHSAQILWNQAERRDVQ